MKQLLSWSVLLLLVACTLPVTAAAADENCDGVYAQNADGHKAITASLDNPVHITLMKKDKIEVYLNLDEDSPTDCKSKDFGTVSLGQCTIKYKFDQGQVAQLTVEVKDQANAVTFAYEEDAPHQARMDFSSQGIMIRGPSVAGSLIPNTNDCWKPDSNQLTLDKVTNDCRLQLEFLEDVIEEVKLDSTKCDTPGPGPAPTNQPASTDHSGSTGATNPSDPTGNPASDVPTVPVTNNSPDPSATTSDQTLPSGETNPTDPGTKASGQSGTPDKPSPTDPVTAASGQPVAPTTTAEGSDSLVIIIVCSVVGVLLLLIIVGIVVYCCIFKKKKKDNEEDAEAAEPKDQDAEADGTQKSEKKEPDAAAAAADGPEAENTQRDSEKKASDQTQSEGADNTQNE